MTPDCPGAPAGPFSPGGPLSPGGPGIPSFPGIPEAPGSPVMPRCPSGPSFPYYTESFDVTNHDSNFCIIYAQVVQQARVDLADPCLPWDLGTPVCPSDLSCLESPKGCNASKYRRGVRSCHTFQCLPWVQPVPFHLACQDDPVAVKIYA